MSLRNPKIAEDITKEIGNVIYNVDKSLSSLTDAQVTKGLSHQQYTISAANKLADFLATCLTICKCKCQVLVLANRNPVQGMQLPDIKNKKKVLVRK
jgi:hypothetical protein